MERLLTESCMLMIKLLNQLLEENKITQQEYEQHVAVKKKFLEDTQLEHLRYPL